MSLNIPSLPPRPSESHKGHYGRAILVGGSTGMSGAITLSGLATLRSGAGLVTVATAASVQPIVASYHPSYMTVVLPEDEMGRISMRAIPRIRELAESANVFAWGPGTGRSEDLIQVTAGMVRELTCPMVIDADGINALAADRDSLTKCIGPRILTPHAGEFQRLVGKSIRDRDAREKAAREFAANHQLLIVLKGHRTFVTNGDQTYHNETGNPGMATAGAGDVLTGVLTGMIAQGMAPFDAACLAVHLHGLAGDLAVHDRGQYALIATDLIEYLPAALLTLERLNGP